MIWAQNVHVLLTEHGSDTCHRKETKNMAVKMNSPLSFC